MKMEIRILIVSFVLYTVNGQYYSMIPCQNDDTCKSVLGPSKEYNCLNGLCMCANVTTRQFDYCTTKDNIVTAKQRGLKRSCKNNEDCEHIEGAQCYAEKICDCSPKMVMSADGQKCLKIVTELSAICNESAQCSAGLEGAECLDGRCHCRATFHYTATNKRCILNKVYGESCTKEEESCYQLADPNGTNALRCSDKNVCKCVKNYIHVNGQCQHSDASRTFVQIFLIIVTVIITSRMV